MEKVKKITKKYFKYIVLVACMCLIFVLYNEVSKKQILSMDTSIYNVISNNIISDSLTPTVVFLTNIGGTVFLIVLPPQGHLLPHSIFKIYPLPATTGERIIDTA